MSIDVSRLKFAQLLCKTCALMQHPLLKLYPLLLVTGKFGPNLCCEARFGLVGFSLFFSSSFMGSFGKASLQKNFPRIPANSTEFHKPFLAQQTPFLQFPQSFHGISAKLSANNPSLTTPICGCLWFSAPSESSYMIVRKWDYQRFVPTSA